GRVRAEQALAENEAQLRALLEATPAMVVLTDADGVARFVSQEWTDFTGIDPARLRGWEHEQLIHPEDVASTEDARREGVLSGKGYDVDYRLRNRDGEYRWVSASLRPAVSPDGRVVW